MTWLVLLISIAPIACDDEEPIPCMDPEDCPAFECPAVDPDKTFRICDRDIEQNTEGHCLTADDLDC